MLRKLALVGMIAVLALTLVIVPATAQQPVEIVWFIGLGTGGNPEQRAVQDEVVAAFNEANPDIRLVVNVADNTVARDTLSTLIAAGNAPDIIGPVGGDGANAFYGNWLDLEPLVEAHGYDLTQWPAAAVDFYRTEEGLIGLPLATFLLTSIIARALRFFFVAALLWRYGAPIRDFIERWLGLLSVLFVILLFLGFYTVRYL